MGDLSDDQQTINNMNIKLTPFDARIDKSIKAEQDKSWHIDLFKVSQLWSKTKGERVKIGILDTGVSEHDNLKESVVCRENFTSHVSDGTTTIQGHDPDFHGTHVAGIIASNHSREVRGIAPKSKIYAGKVIQPRGANTDDDIIYEEDLIRGLKWLIRDVKPDLINLSIKFKEVSKRIHELIIEAYKNHIIVVCGTGNEAKDSVVYPAAYKETLAVGSIDSCFDIKSTSIGDQLNIVAPGVDVYSTIPNHDFGLMTGSSVASAYATGILALLISRMKENGQEAIINLEQIKVLLKNSTSPADDLYLPGFDIAYGNGIINPEFLLQQKKIEPFQLDLKNDFSPQGRKRLLKYLKEVIQKKHISTDSNNCKETPANLSQELSELNIRRKNLRLLTLLNLNP